MRSFIGYCALVIQVASKCISPECVQAGSILMSAGRCQAAVLCPLVLTCRQLHPSNITVTLCSQFEKIVYQLVPAALTDSRCGVEVQNGYTC